MNNKQTQEQDTAEILKWWYALPYIGKPYDLPSKERLCAKYFTKIVSFLNADDIVHIYKSEHPQTENKDTLCVDADKLNHVTVGKFIEWLQRRPDTMDMPLKISFENKTLAICSLNEGDNEMWVNAEIE